MCESIDRLGTQAPFTAKLSPLSSAALPRPSCLKCAGQPLNPRLQLRPVSHLDVLVPAAPISLQISANTDKLHPNVVPEG